MAEVDNEIEIENPDTAEAKASKRKGAAAKTTTRKIRLTLNEEEGSPLADLADKLKDRGLKNVDLSDVVSEALTKVTESWWVDKLDELTPLEWKIQAALDNPEMREKLVSLLEG